MGPAFFWGLILILLGLSLILRIFFHVGIFRVLMALLFIFIGIRILIGRPAHTSSKNTDNVIFGERVHRSTPESGADYNTIFGKTVYDFRDISKFSNPNTHIEFNTVFGSTEVLLPPNIRVQAKVDAVFGSASLPNGNSVAFGSAHYRSENAGASDSTLYIEGNVIFGNLDIRQ